MALILVTGASAGLGLATAAALAEAEHDVVLHARNADRVADQGIRDRMHEVLYGDLAHLDEVVRLAQQANAIGRFDAVIHNAGVLDGPDVFAVNIVAAFVLTAMMMPPNRSIFLSSSMHSSGSTDLGAVEFSRAGNRRAYADSKLYVTALAMTCAGRWPDSMAHAVDPGWVPTRMGGPAATDSLEEGHRTQAWLATADESEISPRSGAYWYHHTPRRPHPAAHAPGFQRDLMRKLEQHTGIAFPT
ncbi:NAD(P)-dependent dehydrogenase (short-subunit alcohol dehydrogenase family) [Kribbella sp. VKM Ac-2527]|uniref:NAD(P)-dependent dehydrogenase (Short-subunit alcohol dehydrogenase family) n=1 Tax=Kribbella caucasensis TaxID=2512215 RepID=A0A4R6KMI8_9ACTN|nr:SDR family NAD(P)-dependent oxidoreductase [Kribbella sp. VKM Ac-2527]TDO51625.1 NAD(P)-dependent dehydrogenase (short-subunit alcohol dehydrogenase family) [Kribbella sp. VKM Ac-2527]